MKLRPLLLGCTILALPACNMAPDWQLPNIEFPLQYHEAAPETLAPVRDGSWKLAEADPQSLQRGDWWKVFADDTLDGLIQTATANNPDLQILSARVKQAQSQTDIADSYLFPTLDVGANAARSRRSTTNKVPVYGNPQTRYSLQAELNYELDLFGRSANNSRAAGFDAISAQEQYHSGLLSLQARVAQQYYTLRMLTAEESLLQRTLGLRQEQESLTQKLLALGEASELDTSRAKSDRALTQSQLLEVQDLKAQSQHALAALLGVPPSSALVEVSALEGAPPAIPAGLPSALLERRPDIRAAQAQIAAANERIGLARAAFFPQIDLTVLGGFESASLNKLFKWSSRTWSLGPVAGTAITAPIFHGGALSAGVDLSEAQYQESIANYRGQVLTAFSEVENGLSSLRLLYGREQALREAVTAAARAQEIADARYRTGYISYLDSLETQRTLLEAQRAHINIMGARFINSIDLVRALGGGWTLASPQRIINNPDDVAPATEEPTQDAIPAYQKPANAPETTLAPEPAATPEPAAAPVESLPKQPLEAPVEDSSVPETISSPPAAESLPDEEAMPPIAKPAPAAPAMDAAPAKPLLPGTKLGVPDSLDELKIEPSAP